eukprot:5897047-Amphidinium_carterae.1
MKLKSKPGMLHCLCWSAFEGLSAKSDSYQSRKQSRNTQNTAEASLTRTSKQAMTKSQRFITALVTIMVLTFSYGTDIQSTAGRKLFESPSLM